MKIRALKAFVIRDAETGALTSIGHNSIAEVDSTLGNQLITDGLAEEYTLISPTGSVNITLNGTYDVTEKASAVVNVEPTFNLAISAVADGTDLLGKDASDLQENIAIANGAITGTLKFVEGYTGFSGDVAEQSGNYLALKVEAISGATLAVELVGGTVGHPVELDADGMIVLRITNTETQSIKVIATKGTVTETVALSISGLTLLDS